MKALITLIRLAKRSLDELRKKQTALENEKAKLQQALKILAEDLKREMQLAAQSPEMGSFYGGFSKRIQERQAALRAEIVHVEEKITQVSEAILEAFADLKKYEIARDQAKARAQADAARKETLMLDEIAATRHQRQKQGEDF